jgi:hypothetical protein
LSPGGLAGRLPRGEETSGVDENLPSRPELNCKGLTGGLFSFVLRIILELCGLRLLGRDIVGVYSGTDIGNDLNSIEGITSAGNHK